MFEVQFHPADIRKQVRYLFVRERALPWLVLTGFLAVGMLIAGLALSPRAISWLVLCLKQARAEHENQHEREALRAQAGALAALERRAEACRVRYSQFSLILGLAPREGYSGGGVDAELAGTSEAVVVQAERLRAEAQALLDGAEELVRFAAKQATLISSVPSISPLPVGTFLLSSPFGQRRSPFTGEGEFHTGLDLAAREQTQVLATGGGEVVFAGRVPLATSVRWWRLGNLAVLRHGDRYLSIYGHLRDVVVRRGQKVSRGENVGTVGNSGWSTSPHLHYEVRVRDGIQQEPTPVDPRIFILNYDWKERESRLAASRWAPAPAFDPLPALAQLR